MSLAGRVAVVTGGGRGIGAAVAEALAGAGAAVAVTARTRPQVEAVATSLRTGGAAAEAFTCDVAEPEQVRALAADVARALGPVDILVNNAGVAPSNPVKHVTLEEWNRALAVNATGTFLCTQAFLGPMVERGWGRVVNVASVAGLTADRYIAAYAASKHAQVGFTRAVAAEVAGTGVTVNAVCPGFVDTDMTRVSAARIKDRTGMAEEDAVAAMLEYGGQERLIRPEEVADKVLALCAQGAGGTNGRTLVIDGGSMPYDLINPEELGRPSGWTNGMLAPPGGRVLFVAGQDPAEPGGSVSTDDFVEQFRLALDKAVTVVRGAGGGPEHIGRLTVFVADVEVYRAVRKELGAAYRSVMGRHFPAMALVQVAGLVDPRAQVEIEATAVIP